MVETGFLFAQNIYFVQMRPVGEYWWYISSMFYKYEAYNVFISKH